MDHDPVNSEDDAVLRKGILPGLQPRMPDIGGHEIHLPHPTLIVLEGRNFLRIRRPKENRTVAFCPPRVVGGVAEILHPVGGELGFLPGCQVTHPQVVVADEGGARAVGRKHGVAVRILALTPLTGAAGAPGVTRIAAGSHVERDRLPVRCGLELRERQNEGIVGRVRRRGERRGQLHMVEGPRARPRRRIDQHELGSLGDRVAIPEAVVGKPCGTDGCAEYEGGRVGA